MYRFFNKISFSVFIHKLNSVDPSCIISGDVKGGGGGLSRPFPAILLPFISSVLVSPYLISFKLISLFLKFAYGCIVYFGKRATNHSVF